MDKEAQDRLWNELSEESKESVLKSYKGYKDKNDKVEYWIRMEYQSLFGSHNLNSKPQIKTWEDVEKSEIDIPTILSETLSYKIIKKNEACTKIAKLIDLSYGGMVSEEEMRDPSKEIYNIYPDEKKQFIIGALNTRLYDFVCFHTQQQAKEFLSYDSNKRLLEQYYMM